MSDTAWRPSGTELPSPADDDGVREVLADTTTLALATAAKHVEMLDVASGVACQAVAFLLVLLAACCAATLSAADKKIVLIAGAPSHGVGEHEHRAGMLLLQSCLAGYPGVKVELVSLTGTGWVPDESVFNDAAAVIIFAMNPTRCSSRHYGRGAA